MSWLTETFINTPIYAVRDGILLPSFGFIGLKEDDLKSHREDIDFLYIISLIVTIQIIFYMIVMIIFIYIAMKLWKKTPTPKIVTAVDEDKKMIVHCDFNSRECNILNYTELNLKKISKPYSQKFHFSLTPFVVTYTSSDYYLITHNVKFLITVDVQKFIGYEKSNNKVLTQIGELLSKYARLRGGKYTKNVLMHTFNTCDDGETFSTYLGRVLQQRLFNDCGIESRNVFIDGITISDDPLIEEKQIYDDKEPDGNEEENDVEKDESSETDSSSEGENDNGMQLRSGKIIPSKNTEN
jgi:hypothetical protein